MFIFFLQDFGRRLERDVKKFVNDRLDATKQLTGQEVGGLDFKNIFCYQFLFSAKTNRGSGYPAPDAEVRGLVRRKHVGVHGRKQLIS